MLLRKNFSFALLAVLFAVSSQANDETVEKVQEVAQKKIARGKKSKNREKEEVVPLPSKKLSDMSPAQAEHAVQTSTPALVADNEETLGGATELVAPPENLTQTLDESEVAPAAALVISTSLKAALNEPAPEAKVAVTTSAPIAAPAKLETAVNASTDMPNVKAATASTPAVVPATVSSDVVIISKVKTVSAPPSVWFSGTLAFLNSRWDKINGGMRKGSVVAGFLLSREIVPLLDASLGSRTIQGTSASGSSNDVRFGAQVVAQARFYLNDHSLRPFSELGLGLGRFTGWKAQSATSGSISFSRDAGGALSGLTPGFGASLQLSPTFRSELALRYDFFFGPSAKHLGGVSLQSGLSFGF